jgi:hypothetical protein
MVVLLNDSLVLYLNSLHIIRIGYPTARRRNVAWSSE